MAISKKIDGTRYYVDHQGLDVPYAYVSKEDRSRDGMIKKVLTRAHRINDVIIKEKAEIIRLIDNYLQQVADKYNTEWKGNATIYDFSHTMKVEININDRVDFDEKLQIAKQKIDECFKLWGKGESLKLKTIATDAFQTDKKGNVNAKKLLGLRRHKFNDKLWREAMDLISESIIIVGSKVYYRFWEKPNQDQDKAWQPVEVNFSAL